VLDTPTIVVRPARPAEYAAVGELSVDAYRHAGVLVDSYAAVLRDVASRARDAELLVATDGEGRLLGTVTVCRPGSRWAEISQEGELEFRALAVAPSATGRGVGRRLVEAVIEIARGEGRHRVVLSVLDSNAVARRLYDRLGFRRLPERDHRPLPDVLLAAYALDLPTSRTD
jgi:ribosomal protein S18 acetylase RimI-like enzyme